MSTIVITVNATTLDEQDRRAQNMIVNNENARRAAADPPEALLPAGTAAERRASYELMLVEILKRAHASYIEQAGEQIFLKDLQPLWKTAGDAKRAAALAALQ